VVFKILHSLLMFHGSGTGLESSQVFPLSGFWIFFPGIETKLTGMQFSDHFYSKLNQRRLLITIWLYAA